MERTAICFANITALPVRHPFINLRPSTSRIRLPTYPISRHSSISSSVNFPEADIAPTNAATPISNEIPSATDAPPQRSTTVHVEFAPGRTVTFETGRIARQAAGSVFVRQGDTMVLCTACVNDAPSPTTDFLPLRVDYFEKFSSTGKTSGSYMKREGKQSEREILTSRLIDRPLRPMFAKGYYNEVQLLAHVYSYDNTHPADGMAICGAAAALHISKIPLVEPVAGVRIAYIDAEFIVEPTVEEMQRSQSELVVAGTRKGILMVEGYAHFLPEEQILAGVKIAHEAICKLCDAIDKLRDQTGRLEKSVENLRVVPEQLIQSVESLAVGVDEALAIFGKKDREAAVSAVKDRVFKQLSPTQEERQQDPDLADLKATQLQIAWKEVISERMRRRIFDQGTRPDGRDVYTVRPITIDQSILPCAHGSSLFTRGETQTLAVATLGGEDMAQRFETLEGEDSARFYLQYSFPPFSVGEVGRMGAPGRREIGHGKLAERAIQAAIPSKEQFSYVIRVESNILESNGSSSMASVCGGCMALLDAGVPMTSSVAGVAMGLVLDKTRGADAETGEYECTVLTDILGLEDALGSCDAKFAGNRSGLSALQLDVKVRGISLHLLERILQQARVGRHHVLDCMDEVMSKPREHLADSVPKMMTMSIPTKRIGDLIGPGGKNIKSIIEKCGGDERIRISIENDGRVVLSSKEDAVLKKAMGIISSATTSIEIGMVVEGKVTKILPFGAYVEVVDGKEGWLHISELEKKRTNSVSDVCAVGDVMRLKVIEVGRNGQFRVSRKACME